MKTFKEYISEKKKDVKPYEDCSFGSHSLRRTDLMQATDSGEFGSHSIEEGSNTMADDRELKSAEHDRIHKEVAPAKPFKNAKTAEAVKKYTDHSTPLNSTLISYHEGHPLNQGLKEHIDLLTDHLNKHSTTEPTIVYTGVRRSPARHFVDHKGEDKEVHFPAFISTSTSLGMARTFAYDAQHPNDEDHGVIHNGEEGNTARHVYRIHLPKGSKASSARDSSFVSKEHEVLLNRGHDMRIERLPDLHIDKKGRQTHIWDAHVVGHSPANLDAEDL